MNLDDLLNNKQNIMSNTSAQAIYKAQQSFEGVSEELGIYDENDVQNLVNEIRYKKE